MTPGTRLGPYEIVERVGAGAVYKAAVYKARDTRQGRLAALKILPGDGAGDPERARQSARDAAAASALNHPNIVRVYDTGEAGGAAYIAMEWISGTALDQLIPADGMRIADVIGYGVQIADALARAHAARIVHGDLKPANVMVTAGGAVKVLDFGVMPGAAAYLSPEQVQGRLADGRSDQFSFGAMLYEMATGRRPFERESSAATLAAVLREEPPPPSEIRPDLPRGADRVIARCLHKDPAQRYADGAGLKSELEALRGELRSGGMSEWLAAGLTAALLAVVAGLYVWARFQDPARGEAALKPVALTSYPGIQDSASFSPDGTRVAFTWNGAGQDNFDIYVKPVGPGEPLRLTADPASDVSPRWSPDGRSIAFLRLTAGEPRRFDAILVPAAGGPERRLAQFDFPDLRTFNPSLCWSGDSTRLIVSASPAAAGDARLLAISVDTGEMRALTHPAAGVNDLEPGMAMDGRSIVFTRATGGEPSKLMVLSVSEHLEPRGEARALSIREPAPREAQWTPEGREIVFSAGLSPASRTIYRISAFGAGTADQWTFAGAGATSPTLAPRGHRLVYTQQFWHTSIWRVALGVKDPVPEQLIASGSRDVFPQYSPDGRRIAFQSGRGGSEQVWTCDANGSQCARVTEMGGATTAGAARWSPDGRQISFDSNAGGKWEIYTAASAGGGRARAVAGDTSVNAAPSWSRDGRWIYFASNRSGQFEIWKAPSQGGAARQVTHGGGTAAVESPAGDALYFSKEDGAGGIWKMPVEGGGESQVLAQPVYRRNFAVDGRGLYFTPLRDGAAAASVQFLNFATGAIAEVAKLAKPLESGLALSPGGQWLLAVQSDDRGSHLMLAEGLP